MISSFWFQFILNFAADKFDAKSKTLVTVLQFYALYSKKS